MSNSQDLSRRKQFTQSYRMAKQTDPALPWWILGAFVLGAALGGGLFWLIPPRGGVFDWIITGVGAFMVGMLLALLVFSRRAQKAAYAQLEGRPGAAAATLTMLKRGWQVDNAVAFTKQQDLVHRVVGKPGIVLVGEGDPRRLSALLVAEKKKYERVAADTPIHDFIVGNGDGLVPLPKLAAMIQKLPKGIEPAQMTDVLNRLKAVDARKANIPLPKGPIPTSMKGQRGNLRGR
ncbi:MAG: DUF4191 domain-containing protein [Nocardioides sp.]|jgi:hypothetical protein